MTYEDVTPLGITMGDPYGIGPEIIIKTIHDERPDDIVIIGDFGIMEKARQLFAPEVALYPLGHWEDFDARRKGAPVLDCGENMPVGSEKKMEGRGATAEGGRLSIGCIRWAVTLAMEGKTAGIVTAPISKEAIHRAGYEYPGHTELLAELTGTEKFAMMLAGGTLKVILVTTHCPLSKVSGMISKDKIYDILMLTHNWWMRFLGHPPKLAVAALNPHGGEGGIFGHEEEIHIKPAISQAYAEGVAVTGPYPADTLFHFAKDGRFDAVVVMYHDQGLIPLKMLAFGKGVNCTIGLPIIRTSVDHGTAYDIAWKGKADTSSLKEALKMARSLVSRGTMINHEDHEGHEG